MPKLLSKVAVAFYIPTSKCLLPNTCVVCFLILPYLAGMKSYFIVLSIYISWRTNDFEHILNVYNTSLFVVVPWWLSRLSVFVSGHDLWVLGSSPLWDSLLSGESASPSPSAPSPLPACALSLSQINKIFLKDYFSYLGSSVVLYKFRIISSCYVKNAIGILIALNL